MTIPFERTRAVLYTKQFLEELLNPKVTPRIPRSIRGRAKALLRHYPGASDINRVSRWAADVFGPVPALPFCPNEVEVSDFTFTIRYQLTEDNFNQDALIEGFSEVGFSDVLVGIGRPGVLALQLTCAAGNAQDALFSTLVSFRKLAPGATLIEVAEQVTRVGSDLPPHIS